MAYSISAACTKCGACLPECPTGSVLEGKKQFYIDADTCADHAACVNVCPVDAISQMSAASRPQADPSQNGQEEEE